MGILNQINILRLSCCFALIFLIVQCPSASESEYEPQFSDNSSTGKHTYVFGIHPLHNPARLHETFGPLADLLSENIPEANFRIEASRNYSAFDKKLYAGKFDFTLPNPYQTVLALKKGYRVFGKMGDDFNFRGIIVARKDSKIRIPSDLKGHAVSFPAPTALAATMLPQFYLQTHGLNVMKDIQIKYVGSQESSIMNVYYKTTTAGATWPPPWKALLKEKPELAKEMKVLWQTDPLPSNSLMARNDIPEDLIEKVSQVIFNLHKNERGRKILEKMELSKFEPASESTYLPVKIFIQEFSTTVRPVNQ